MQFVPTRAAGLERLAEFLPRAGRAYANTRNYDDGASAGKPRTNVSQLSPWLHAGLLSEAEVLEAVLDKHSPSASEKFTAEVFWRVYFKGYLEQRPSIWSAYCDRRDAALSALGANTGLAKAYDEAIRGRTGIEAFDHWARELALTGYLHNHARMWFASIWIFSLKLDWTLGADLFLRHLVDGDAASNTLSWRWVGGLHTKGKTYLARADNIARYTVNQTGGALGAQGLAPDAPPLDEPTEHSRTPITFPSQMPAPDAPFALVLHDEAASHVPLDLTTKPALVIGAARPSHRSPGEVGEAAAAFATQSLENGLREASQAFGCETRIWHAGDSLDDLLAQAGIEHLALPHLPTGWTRDALMPDLAPMIQQGRVTQLISELDRTTWPLAKAGFFGVKKQIEPILAELGIGAASKQLPLL